MKMNSISSKPEMAEVSACADVLPPCRLSLEFHHAFTLLGRHDALRSPLKFPDFASIVVILPAFPWRKLLAPHPPPLVPVDGANPFCPLHTLLPQS